jgi:hypothetical protein
MLRNAMQLDFIVSSVVSLKRLAVCLSHLPAPFSDHRNYQLRRRSGNRNLDDKPSDSYYDPLRALVRNEIDLAWVFVAAARSAYESADFAYGDFASQKAETIHSRASQLVAEHMKTNEELLCAELRELVSVLDQLRMPRSSSPSHKSEL